MSGPVALVILLLVSCSPSPEPKATSAVADDDPREAPRSKAKQPDASAAPDAGDASISDASADVADSGPAEPVYREPAPVVVRRHHVFATFNARAGKRVTLTSLLTTASDDHPDLEAGTEATLQLKVKADWTDIGKVKVVSVTNKGNRAVGTERQEIAADLVSEEPKTKSAYVRGTKLRLQVDRPAAP